MLTAFCVVRDMDRKDMDRKDMDRNERVCGAGGLDTHSELFYLDM